ncbi:unnamed protein product [Nippostrongylus brasiliensis]|uniref:WD and tetratricopeptide repeats protein 1 n=1 Tax=Nippostrongylus brasiliensis TaxID=27835 RepID=A0A0N4XTU6_NIPBR|nr:unnamed protein product [Nippostrongylus brasiliensis]
MQAYSLRRVKTWLTWWKLVEALDLAEPSATHLFNRYSHVQSRLAVGVPKPPLQRRSKAHEACVNTLRWNQGGTLLASGSDDRKVKVWNLAGDCLTSIDTGHQANVFAVEFLPAGNDRILISAAGDRQVKMHDIDGLRDEPINWSTGGRVKRLATAQDEPYMFWSASEDGYVREYDARTNEEKKLIDTEGKHVKSFAICQGRTELMAVATDEAPVPIYDRRMPNRPFLTCVNVHSNGKHTLSFAHARELAKGYFDSKKFPEAIEIYSRALSLTCSNYDRSILLANRGMGYLCRRWEGDSYACVRDCAEALLLYPGNSKALWRLSRSLMLLEQWDLAKDCIEVFKKRFPNDKSIVRLTEQITVAMDSSYAHHSHVMSDDANVVDYSERFCGQTNTHTDIKEANFFGSKNQYVVAGSDCGSLLCWERRSGVLVAAWNADQSILNIVQPHPSQFMLATSGIEEVIRFWEPMEEGKECERRITEPWAHFGQRNRHSADERDIFLRFIGSRMMGRSPERPECVTS